MWYAFSFFSVSVKQEDVRRELQDEERRQREKRPSDLEHRIKIVLIECRMALPGAQALLGFQLANVFTQGFEKLPRSSQWFHFGSLLSTMICAILLIAPAQYHRIAEGGEDTEHFHKVASRFLLGALVFLAYYLWPRRAAEPAQQPFKTVAVLPFKPLSKERLTARSRPKLGAKSAR